jgi:glutamyl-tRNA synthetase
MTTSSDRPVRVRIAPSPTGDPHVGTGYIALFNYAFAKSQGGKFVLRIEDTDRERSNAESERQIFHSLRWLGLDWDEGPDVGGPHGPYRQSERKDMYAQYAWDLVEKGRAYPCFCTPERLKEMRQGQMDRKESFLGYDKQCMSIPADEAKKRAEAGESHVIRLDVPKDGETVIHDKVRGDVTFRNDQIDDQVLLKSDGFPTYHLANVVDDYLMEITHVIRAEEWIVSTPKHVMMYDAFGWEAPAFIHMPLLRNKDKSKISKRKNPTSLLWYEEEGFLPEALRNFLALMGWSAEEGKEKFDLDTMIQEFDWKRVSTGAPVFDMDKLEWLNGVYIRDMADDELVARLQSGVLKDKGIDEAFLRRTLPIVRERMKRLQDYVPVTAFLFADTVEPATADLIPKKSSAEEAAAVLGKSVEAFGAMDDWSPEALEARTRELIGELEVKGGTVFMALRVAITGSRVSPPTFESMELLGKEKSLARLEAARQQLIQA